MLVVGLDGIEFRFRGNAKAMNAKDLYGSFDIVNKQCDSPDTLHMKLFKYCGVHQRSSRLAVSSERQYGKPAGRKNRQEIGPTRICIAISSHARINNVILRLHDA